MFRNECWESKNKSRQLLPTMNALWPTNVLINHNWTRLLNNNNNKKKTQASNKLSPVLYNSFNCIQGTWIRIEYSFKQAEMFFFNFLLKCQADIWEKHHFLKNIYILRNFFLNYTLYIVECEMYTCYIFL